MAFFVSNYSFDTNLKPAKNEISIAIALESQLEFEI